MAAFNWSGVMKTLSTAVPLWEMAEVRAGLWTGVPVHTNLHVSVQLEHTLVGTRWPASVLDLPRHCIHQFGDAHGS